MLVLWDFDGAFGKLEKFSRRASTELWGAVCRVSLRRTESRSDVSEDFENLISIRYFNF